MRGKKHVVVVVGASAGGLEALKQFLEQLRLADYVAFAVIQHLSPDRQSHMREILGGATSLPVKTIEDGRKVHPGHIYCNPPGKEVSLFRWLFRPTDPEATGTLLPSTTSSVHLAEDQDKNAVRLACARGGTPERSEHEFHARAREREKCSC